MRQQEKGRYIMTDLEKSEIIAACEKNAVPENEIDFLIPSPDGKAFICPICIDLCEQIIDEYGDEALSSVESENALSLDKLPTPMEIKGWQQD